MLSVQAPFMALSLVELLRMCVNCLFPLQIRPRVAYLLLAINVGVYAAGLVAGLGPDGANAQQDYFLALAKTDVGVEAGEYYRCACSQSAVL